MGKSAVATGAEEHDPPPITFALPASLACDGGSADGLGFGSATRISGGLGAGLWLGISLISLCEVASIRRRAGDGERDGEPELGDTAVSARVCFRCVLFDAQIPAGTNTVGGRSATGRVPTPVSKYGGGGACGAGIWREL